MLPVRPDLSGSTANRDFDHPEHLRDVVRTQKHEKGKVCPIPYRPPSLSLERKFPLTCPVPRGPLRMQILPT